MATRAERIATSPGFLARKILAVLMDGVPHLKSEVFSWLERYIEPEMAMRAALNRRKNFGTEAERLEVGKDEKFRQSVHHLRDNQGLVTEFSVQGMEFLMLSNKGRDEVAKPGTKNAISSYVMAEVQRMSMSGDWQMSITPRHRPALAVRIEDAVETVAPTEDNDKWAREEVAGDAEAD